MSVSIAVFIDFALVWPTEMSYFNNEIPGASLGIHFLLVSLYLLPDS